MRGPCTSKPLRSKRREFLHILLLCATWCATTHPLRAQTVRPVIADYSEKARGRFDLVNSSALPMNVILEAKSFSIDEDGSPRFRPLDKDIQLKLSQKSFRVPPQQTYYVFYEASAPRYPAWFVIYASFSEAQRQSGLNFHVELPHTVYMGQRVALTRNEVEVGRSEYLKSSHQVVIEVRNIGARLGRVSQVEVRNENEKTVYPGFPLMPGNRRKIVIEWKQSAAPLRAIVDFDRFKIDTPIKEGQH
jgi:hypothetical protein